MDEHNIDFPALVERIRETFGTQCVLLNVPIGHGGDFKGVAGTLKPGGEASGALVDPSEIHTALIESIIEVDEELMMKYFEGEEPTPDQFAGLIVQAVAKGTLVPIVCCAAKTGVGLSELLDALVQCALPPTAVARKGNKDGAEVEIACDPSGPVVAQVFKTRIDPFVQKLSYIRVYSGTLKKDDTVPVCGSRKGVKLGPLLDVQGGETKPVESASAGDVVAIAKMEDLHTGTCLGAIEVPKIPYPTPMVGLAVTPKSRNDEAKLSASLHKIVEEDSTFKLDRDSQTKELVMTGMSELHLQIIRERLHRRDKLDVDTKQPKIPFRETIQTTAEGMYRHKKQSGGRGQFGEVHIRMFPFPRGTKPEDFCTKDRFPHMKEFHYDELHNFLWVNTVVGGTIPSNFLPAVEKGFKERMEKGVIANCMVQDVAVEVHFGKYHDVDREDGDHGAGGERGRCL
jgi:elongation factor G